MIELLKKFNYTPPNLLLYKNKNIEVRILNNNAELFVDNSKWNNYNFTTHSEAFQVFSHYFLASGHCICTGLGFGVRESWLLSNPNVTKITVLEKNSSVIEYHKYNKSSFLDKIEIIECDANEYKGICDTLLLDHYEQEKDDVFIESIRKVQTNIKCKNMWVWSIETIIDELSHKKNLKQTYDNFKKQHNLYQLPDLNLETLMLFFSMFFITDILKNTLIDSKESFYYD